MLNTVILKSQKLINQDLNLYLLISVIRTSLKFWWRLGESNSWPPACKAGALPTKLSPQLTSSVMYLLFYNFNQSKSWWVWQDLNLWPHAYQACALTSWATGPALLPGPKTPALQRTSEPARFRPVLSKLDRRAIHKALKTRSIIEWAWRLKFLRLKPWAVL